MKFECHVTVDRDQLALAASIVGESYRDVHTSAIDGDPELGKGVNGYLTFHTNDIEEATLQLATIVIMLRSARVAVRRKKIEAIVLDVRYT